MDDVLQCLWDACEALGIPPDEPFGTVLDFKGHILQKLPPVEEAAKEDALFWITKAVEEAPRHQTAGVVKSIEHVADLSRRPS